MNRYGIPFAIAAFFAALLFTAPAEAQETFPPSFLRDNCIELPDIEIGPDLSDARDCGVSQFGPFGVVGAQEYFYALYCLIPGYADEGTTCASDTFTANYHRRRGLAIFRKESPEEELTLMLSRATPEIGIYVYDRPEIIESSAGTVLVVPIRVDGTGSGNESEYYLRQEGIWLRLDATSWLQELRRRIPEQFGMWKGLWPDLRTMTAKTGLYRPDDANCCPTGGEIRVQLTIRDGALVIIDLTIEGSPEEK